MVRHEADYVSGSSLPLVPFLLLFLFHSQQTAHHTRNRSVRSCVLLQKSVGCCDVTRRWYICAHVSIDGLYCRWSFDFHTSDAGSWNRMNAFVDRRHFIPFLRYFIFIVLLRSIVFSSPFRFFSLCSGFDLSHDSIDFVVSFVDLFIGEKTVEKYDVHCFLHSRLLSPFLFHIFISFGLPSSSSSQALPTHSSHTPYTIAVKYDCSLYVFHRKKELLFIWYSYRSMNGNIICWQNMEK